MDEPYFWYVLYVRTNAEQRVMKDLSQAYHKRSFGYGFEPFCPESEIYYRGKKTRTLGKQYRKRPMFPNYVFVETQMPSDEFLKEFSSYVYNSPDIVRVLHYGGSSNIALDEGERRRFEYLFKGKRCLERSEGYIVGDKVTISAGPLVGQEGLITYVNRHNRLAVISVEMFGGRIEAKVALEIVEKTEG